MMVLLLVGVLLAYLLQKKLYEKFWHRYLEVRVRFTEPFVYEGDESCLEEEIVNRKQMPLPALEVRFAMDRALAFVGEAEDNSNVTDQSYRRDIFSLFVRQRVVRRLPILCKKRGVYRISAADLVGYNFLLREHYYKRVEQSTQMYVYPGPVDVSRIRLVCQAVSGMVLVQSRLYPDPFEFAGIREYHPSDPMRQVNWKASARNGELLVNQFDSTTNMQVRILLDVRDEGIWKREELTEEAIRIAASLAAQLVKKSVEVDFVCNGTIREETAGEETDGTDTVAGAGQQSEVCGADGGIHLRLRPGAARIMELYRVLACLDTSGRTGSLSDALQLSSGRSGYVQVLISHNQDPETAEHVRRLARSGSQVLWIVPVSHNFPLVQSPVEGVPLMQWMTE